jgi:hypothetical protein
MKHEYPFYGEELEHCDRITAACLTTSFDTQIVGMFSCMVHQRMLEILDKDCFDGCSSGAPEQ